MDSLILALLTVVCRSDLMAHTYTHTLKRTRFRAHESFIADAPTGCRGTVKTLSSVQRLARRGGKGKEREGNGRKGIEP